MLILKCDTKTSLQSTSLTLINCHFSQPNLTSSSSYTAAAWIPTSRRIGRFLGRGKEVLGKDKSQHFFLFFTGDHEEIQTLFLFFFRSLAKELIFCRTLRRPRLQNCNAQAHTQDSNFYNLAQKRVQVSTFHV